MGGKCESDKEQSIGCQQTQKMDSAIREPQKNYLSFLVWIITGICSLALLIGGLFVYRTFWPNSYPKEIRMDVRVDGEETSKRLPLNTFLWIWPDIQVDLGGSVSEETKAKIKLELSEALLAMEARAAAAYNEKFATLLTILTIFGNKAEESLKQAREAREKAQECLDDIPKTKMRIFRCNGDLYYELAFFEARNCTDWSTKNQTEKEDILYRFAFSMESYIHAILAEKDNVNNIITVLLPKMDSICEKVKTIIPDMMKSERLGQKFGSLVFLVGDIPGENPNKTKLRNQLEKIANELRENKVSEPQISEEGK